MYGTPPLNSGRIVAEILGGGVGGIIGIYSMSGESLEGHGTPAGLLGAISLGSSAGVYLIGNAGRETGSFSVTLFGSVLGSLVGVFLAESTEAVSLLVLPPIGAAVGFNATRKYAPPTPSGTALISFSHGQASLAVPVICFRRSQSAGESHTPSLNLLSARL